MKRFLVGSLFALLTVAGHAAAETEEDTEEAVFSDAVACSGLSDDLRGTIEALYESALIADYAFSKNGNELKNECSGHVTYPWDDSTNSIVLYTVPFRSSNIESFWDLVEDNEGYYNKNDDTVYLTCRSEKKMERLSVTWKNILLGVGENDTFRAVRRALLFEVGFIVTRASSLFSMEEAVGVEHVRNDDGEEYFLIKGTNPHKLKEWQASLQDLFSADGSCVFDIAATVTGRFSNQIVWPGNSLVVAGHSLGGSVTQYITADRTHNQERYNPNIQYSAHSFNGVGLDRPPQDLEGLYSFYIDGEIIKIIADELGRSQAGQPIGYVLDMRDSALGSYLNKNGDSPVQRHSLYAVKLGLCDCLKGKGKVD